MFVESLTHDSVIVQIPRLHGQVNTRLDKVLSIFDQTQQSTLLRKSIQLFLKSGMTYDAIAQELGIDVEQVKAAMT